MRKVSGSPFAALPKQSWCGRYYWRRRRKTPVQSRSVDGSRRKENGSQREGDELASETGSIPIAEPASFRERRAGIPIPKIHLQIAARICGICRGVIRFVDGRFGQFKFHLHADTDRPKYLPHSTLFAVHPSACLPQYKIDAGRVSFMGLLRYIVFLRYLLRGSFTTAFFFFIFDRRGFSASRGNQTRVGRRRLARSLRCVSSLRDDAVENMDRSTVWHFDAIPAYHHYHYVQHGVQASALATGMFTKICLTS